MIMNFASLYAKDREKITFRFCLKQKKIYRMNTKFIYKIFQERKEKKRKRGLVLCGCCWDCELELYSLTTGSTYRRTVRNQKKATSLYLFSYFFYWTPATKRRYSSALWGVLLMRRVCGAGSRPNIFHHGLHAQHNTYSRLYRTS